MTIFPIDIDICHVKHSLEGSSLKGQTERMADQALCTVAADQVFGIYSFRFAAGDSYLCADAAFILCEAFQFGLPANIFAVRSDEVVQDLFMFALLDDQHIWIGTHPFTDRAELDLAADFAADDKACLFRNGPRGDQFIGQADLLVNLERARLDAYRL